MKAKLNVLAETFDIGTDQESPVSLGDYDQVPFTFNGKIGETKNTYSKK